MNLLDRYIGRQVFWAIIVVLLVLSGLALLFAFIDALGDVDENYGVMDALRFVLFTGPRWAYEMLPMAALIGCLVGLGGLASHSELTVMRASGVSIARIVWAVMRPLILIMLVGVFVGEYVAPVAEKNAQETRALALGGGQAQSSKRGFWHREGREYVHVNAVQSDGRLIGVTRYQFGDKRQLLEASFAREAHFTDGAWQLEDVAITRFLNERTEVINEPNVGWDSQLTPYLLGVVTVEPNTLSLEGLWGYIHYLSEQGLNNGRYWLAFWSKLFQPLVTMALVLMAISFIFGPLRSVTLGQRVFTGVVVGFVIRIAQDLLGPASLVFGFSPLVAVLLPAAVCALAGLYLLKRAG